MEEVSGLLTRAQALVAAEQDAVQKARMEAEKALESQRAALAKERQQFELERRAVSRVTADSKELVRLNVGGVIYDTTVSTLCKEESFLSALVSGRHALVRSERDDAIFIDRDGVAFRHILNYLRRGRLLIPDDDATLGRELLEEARFYQLASLIELLQPRKVALAYSADSAEHAGLFHWLGTGARTREWINPAVAGAVRVRSSKPVSGAPEGLVGRVACAGGICKDARGHWVEVDIGRDRLLSPSHYSLRPGQCCRLGNWRLEASEDRTDWSALSTHVDEFWEPEKAVKAWQLPEKRKYYRWFRLVGSGRDAESLTCYCAHFSCLELYGTLRIAQRKERKQKEGD
jgi:hypothetical protein